MKDALYIGLWALGLALPGAALGQVYKTVLPDGTMRYSNTSAGGGQRLKTRRTKLSGKTSGGPVADLSFAPLAETLVYDGYIEEACRLYRIPPALVRAVMATESAFNPRAVSVKGAVGLMQLMPETAADMFVEDIFDPRQNILGGVRYLRVLANAFEGDMVRIVAAYNAGPEAVRRAGGVPEITETQGYVRRVVQLYYAYKKGNP